MKQRNWLLFLVTGMLLYATACVRNKNSTTIPTGNYPTAVGNILLNKCATAGCHSATSGENAARLFLNTWENLFRGSSGGSVVIPYSPETSPLLFYVNTDSSRGPVATPTMPLSSGTNTNAALTPAEYATLKDWIANGAPDVNGNIAFASNAATRQKIYITEQGCDRLTVIDGESHLIMRSIPIGTANNIESPHCFRPNGASTYGYVSFLAGKNMQQIDMSQDKVVANINLDVAKLNGSWNILFIAPDDKHILTSNWQGDGLIARIDATTNAVTGTLGGGSTMVYPHGIASNRNFDTFFITSQYGNVVYKVSDNQLYYKKLSLNGLPPSESLSPSGSPDPHEILADTGLQRLFVSCEGTNEVKVLEMNTGKVLATIPVGTFPQEMAISKATSKLFVTCMEDATSVPGMKGSVYAIDYNTYETTKIEGDFYQPHGIAVDDKHKAIYIVSTNSDPAGPPPHHATACNGRAGWYSVYDVYTLMPLSYARFQLSTLPYSAGARFH